jgi:hypothetical protein
MKGDRVEAVVDTGQGTQTFVIEATRAGRRTGRFMSSRLIALVEHPAHEGRQAKVDVSIRRRITTAGED